MTATTIDKVKVDGQTLAYRELVGSGPPVVLLHGWPTSSFLWRNVMPAIARSNRVVALDMPGFGGSDKPGDARYDFDFFERALDGFLEALEIDETALAVHDLGGPVGVHWAINRPERLTKLALLNTLLYPEFSEAVIEFVTAASTPGQREELTSPRGLEAAMRLGLADEANLSDEVLVAVQEPFRTDESRRALARAGIGVQVDGFVEIARRLGSLRVPVRIVYGERDRILPDVAETMARVKRDLPQADITALPCGHFLQEEAPEEIGELLAEFFAEAT
jgi:haloalkane dehalogenase